MSVMQARRALRPPPLPVISRAQFLTQLATILGAGSRILYTPNGTDTITSVESSPVGRTITWDNDTAARRSPLLNLWQQSFSGTGQYGDAADAADLSFGNGTVDQAVSLLALVNPTNTGAARTLLGKFTNSSAGEYRWTLSAADRLTLFLTDASVSVNVTRTADISTPNGRWSLLAATYDGRGGATAMDGATLYQNDALLPSTASNNASYVAMEDIANVLQIGSQQAHIAAFQGSEALVAMTQALLTGTDIARIAQLCRQAAGLVL